MARRLKADFHLHTYHSDNRDRMTPAEYAELARQYGYDVLGFCDHHHNLTHASWETLRAEVQDLAADDLLLTTGYEATWMAGHLCVLGKETFDGATIAECDEQMWSPRNTRILAHPDNNLCAWDLPLPVGVQGVEVINSGQDPYSVRLDSPCNGLQSFQRYLLLNHPVAAIAQSDCHQRAVFGRVWTELVAPDTASLTWETVQTGLAARRTLAVMGDLQARVWTEQGAELGDTVTASDDRALHWQTSPGCTVTVYVADRPVARFAADPAGTGSYRLRHNGPHWLLVQRGLAWIVTSPITVQNQPAATPDQRQALVEHSVVQHTADKLARRLDWLEATYSPALPTAYPAMDYLHWLRSLLPHNWTAHDAAFSLGDPADWAMRRMAVAQDLLTPILGDLLRCSAQPARGEPDTGLAPAVLVAAPKPPLPAGVYRFDLDVPRDWETLHLVDEAGEPLPAVAFPTRGVRDPLHGMRTPEQMAELVPWLQRGEMHEYRLQHVQIDLASQEHCIQLDLYPAAYAGAGAPYPTEAEQLAQRLARHDAPDSFVHLRAPRRFTVVVTLAEWPSEERRTLYARPGPAPARHNAPENNTPDDEGISPFLRTDALANDPLSQCLVVQIR